MFENVFEVICDHIIHARNLGDFPTAKKAQHHKKALPSKIKTFKLKYVKFITRISSLNVNERGFPCSVNTSISL